MILLSALFAVVAVVMLITYLIMLTAFKYKEALLRRRMKRDRRIYEAREMFLANRLSMHIRREKNPRDIWN